METKTLTIPTQTMTKEMAIKHLDELALSAKDTDLAEIGLKLAELGVPTDIVTILQEITVEIVYIGEKMYEIGKIILAKIWEFIQQNPGLTIGIALGIAVTILASSLVSILPLGVGALLSSLVTFIGQWLAIPLSAIFGAQVDKIRKKNTEAQMREILEEIMGSYPKAATTMIEGTLETIKSLFSLILEVLSAVAKYIKEDKGKEMTSARKKPLTAIGAAAVGAVVGSAAAGPVGMVIGGVATGIVGYGFAERIEKFKNKK